MRIIAHRANLHGPSPTENTNRAIEFALSRGFDVEADVWWSWRSGGSLWLGHAGPVEQVALQHMFEDRIWWHAKDTEALIQLLKSGRHCFMQQQDEASLTSRGFVWCHERSPIDEQRAVCVTLGQFFWEAVPSRCAAVCTDYPVQARESANV